MRKNALIEAYNLVDRTIEVESAKTRKEFKTYEQQTKDLAILATVMQDISGNPEIPESLINPTDTLMQKVKESLTTKGVLHDNPQVAAEAYYKLFPVTPEVEKVLKLIQEGFDTKTPTAIIRSEINTRVNEVYSDLNKNPELSVKGLPSVQTLLSITNDPVYQKAFSDPAFQNDYSNATTYKDKIDQLYKVAYQIADGDYEGTAKQLSNIFKNIVVPANNKDRKFKYLNLIPQKSFKVDSAEQGGGFLSKLLKIPLEGAIISKELFDKNLSKADLTTMDGVLKFMYINRTRLSEFIQKTQEQ